MTYVQLPPDMKLVATIESSDGKTIHVEFGSMEEVDATRDSFIERFGPDFSWVVTAQPATWSCRGTDGCEVVA